MHPFPMFSAFLAQSRRGHKRIDTDRDPDADGVNTVSSRDVVIRNCDVIHAPHPCNQGVIGIRGDSATSVIRDIFFENITVGGERLHALDQMKTNEFVQNVTIR